MKISRPPTMFNNAYHLARSALLPCYIFIFGKLTKIAQFFYSCNICYIVSQVATDQIDARGLIEGTKKAYKLSGLWGSDGNIWNLIAGGLAKVGLKSGKPEQYPPTFSEEVGDAPQITVVIVSTETGDSKGQIWETKTRHLHWLVSATKIGGFDYCLDRLGLSVTTVLMVLLAKTISLINSHGLSGRLVKKVLSNSSGIVSMPGLFCACNKYNRY